MTNVMIVEDQTMPRKLFEMIVESSNDFMLIYSIENASYAELYCQNGNIDLILMDVVTAGEENGLVAAEKIKKRFPHIKIIIVTSMAEYSYLDRAREARVDSFWYKEVSREPILQLMNRTMAGESVYPDTTPELQMGLVSSGEFTATELAVLREVISGDTNPIIAERMFISVDAVKFHIRNMLEKTGFRSRTELAVKARQAGLVIRDKD